MSKHTLNTNPYQGLSMEQVLTTMRQLQQQEEHTHFEMGQLYNYVVQSELLKDTPYKNALDFICGNVQEVARSSLAMYGAVAHAFSKEVVARFGMSRLRLMLTYKKAAGITLNHDEPGSTFIVVPGDNGEPKPKLFADCTAEDLRKALARLRSPTSHEPIPEEDRARYDTYRKAVLDSFPQGTPIRVMLRNHEGTPVIDFKGVPVSQVDKLTEALLDQLYEVRELPEAAPAAQPS